MSRLCLYLPVHPTRRESERLRSVAKALAPHMVCLIGGPANNGRQVIDRLVGHLDVPRFPVTSVAARKTEIEALELDAVVSLAEETPGEPGLGIIARHGVWTLVDGDPRRYCGLDALGGVIAEGGSYVAVTLKQLQPGQVNGQILAFADVPRRPWDGIKKLQRRLDVYLPLIIEEALERVKNADHLSFTPAEQTPSEVRPRSFNLKQRVTDAKYLAHLALKPFPRLFRNGKTNIILFHNPTPDILDDLLAQFSKLGPFLRYSKAIGEFRAGRSLTPGFVITFDDGYKQNMAVLDVLDKHRCNAMFFVNTAPVDRDCPLWFMNRDTEFRKQKAALKAMPYQGFLKTIDKVGLTQPSRLRGRFGLKSEEIRTLAARGHELGVHTHNHPFLSQLAADEIRYEVSECHDRLRTILGDDSLPLHVAYPDGDYNDQVLAVLGEMGATSAVTIHPGSLNEARHPLEIPRYGMADVDYPGFALFKLTDVYAALKGSPD